MNKKCKCNEITTIKFSTILVRSILSISKSIFLNILIFIAGIVLGYYITTNKIQNQARSYDVKECVVCIDESISTLEEFDKLYAIEEQKIKNCLKQIRLQLMYGSTNNINKNK